MKSRLHLLAAVVVCSLASLAGAAGIEPAQSRPKRPLVLPDEAADLHVGLAFDIHADPEFGMFDIVRIPIGADVGLGNNWEVGGLLDLNIEPAVTSTLHARARYGFGKSRILGIGLGMTVPLGYLIPDTANSRIGPEGLPLVLEAPVVRLEGIAGALQAAIRWNYQIKAGPDTKAMDLAVAGIIRLGQHGFGFLEAGTEGPDLKFGDARPALGAGVGYFITPAFVAKLQARTPDMTKLNSFEVLLFVINTSFSETRRHESDWLY
ncbi:MAG: hypothetical protein V3T05_01950 [Myxococcota bacterium]